MSQVINTPLVQEWANPARHHFKWASRARVAARMCAPERWVCDLGCGLQYLKSFLPRQAIYLPADLTQWTSDTEVCDLDAGMLPLRSLANCDICVMLGVIGHLRKPQLALQNLAPHAERVLISFNSTDFTRRRRAPGRARAFPLPEMYAMLESARFTIIDQAQYLEHTLIKAESKLFDAEARRLRDERRISFRASRHTLADEWRRFALRVRTLRTALHRI